MTSDLDRFRQVSTNLVSVQKFASPKVDLKIHLATDTVAASIPDLGKGTFLYNQVATCCFNVRFQSSSPRYTQGYVPDKSQFTNTKTRIMSGSVKMGNFHT